MFIFNNKSKNIIKMAQSVLTEYDGKSHDQKKLMKLAGVGNKTANVFMIEFEQANLMAVDTHVLEFLIDWDLVMEKQLI